MLVTTTFLAQDDSIMSQRRVGLWMIGAFGGVGTTAALGLAALSRRLTDTTSLVTALPVFEGLGSVLEAEGKLTEARSGVSLNWATVVSNGYSAD